MNSAELQKRHSRVYENFFLSNTTVVSAPFLINRSGDVHPSFSGVSIKQKLPLRLYIGLQKNNLGENIIGHVYSYDPQLDIFELQKGENYATYGAALLLELNKLLPKDKEGLTIEILSEIPRTIGLGYNSVLSLCLSILTMIEKDGSIVNQLISLPTIAIQHALKSNELLHKALCTSMELDMSINGKMGVSLKISSFFDGYYPIISFKDKSGHIIEKSKFKDLGFYGLRMNELREDLQDISFPFDFGIIVSDKPVLRENLKNINYRPFVSVKELEHIKSRVDAIVPASKRVLKKQPRFYRFLNGKEDIIYDTYGAMMGAISIETLNIFGRILSSYYSDEMLSLFFSTINKIRYGNNIVRQPSAYFLGFIDELLSTINLPSSEFAVFPNDTLIMGGTLTYASYSAKNRHTIRTGIEALRTRHPGAQILYSSSMDGIAHKGLIIEQFIKGGIVSKHLRNNSWQLEDFTGNKAVGDFNYLINREEYDLVLDTFNSKIYYKGQKLTSNDISSQSTTIEVLRLLFISKDKEISNKNLSISSYSKNKNELNSKIITPLSKWAKKATGKDCIIKASGSLSDFIIYIKHNDLKIAFLGKKES